MRVDFSVCSAQTRAHKAFTPGHTVCLGWGRGIGKSWFTRIMWYLLVAEWEYKTRPGAPHTGVRIVLLMPTLEQARKVHADLMLSEIEGEWAFLGGRVNRASWTVTFPGGSKIQWVTAERAQHIRGIRCDVVCIDEADDIDIELLHAITKPWFSEPHSLRMTLISGTPRRGRKGLLWHAYHDLPKLDPTKYFSFHATAYDAPKLVDPAYVDEVKATTPEPIFKREWLCDFDSAEGLVYPMFSDRFHVREPPADIVWDEMLIGADHGFEDPGVILLIGVVGHGEDAIAWVIHEIYERHRDVTWWTDMARQAVGWYPDAKWYPDTARPDIIESWRKVGASIRQVDKSAGSIEYGVGTMQRFLHVRTRGEREFSRLYVSPACKNTLNEFGMYRRRRDGRNTEIVTEDIEDKNNHALDAIRYAIVGRFASGSSGRNDAHMDNRQ